MSYYFSTPTSRAGYKIRTFLYQININHKDVDKPFRLNKKVLIPFMKDHNLKYKVMNQRYKGINTADLQNCYTILESKEIWDKFRQWAKDNKNIINNT